MTVLITLVVPVFNEEAAVPLFYTAVRSVLKHEPFKVEILFVDDGSTDSTRSAIDAVVERDPLVSVVALSRNFGKEPALLAGIDHASGEAVIPIDVDLQDPIQVIPALVSAWQAGADVVLAKRVDRLADSMVKRQAAHWFYQTLNAISTNKIEENVGDFRLLSRKTVRHIQSMPERNVFMKGVMQWVGGRCAIVEYRRPARAAGVSKFNGWKLWNLALEGITSFSTLPLRVWSYVGAFVAMAAMGFGGYLLLRTALAGNAVPGYASLMVTILFLGGVQLIGIGVLGEYIGRIYAEAKSRPRYIVDATAGYVQVSPHRPSLDGGQDG